ncbi:hypothetical protein BDW59DRAFT_169242 [Aspergillus cavernicola]|uniref:BRCT domain-containing protein n=1 Tax=Aspergillus cavernicola TaxID=176166 RepID=A0ABR4IZ17_9EURO
MPADIRSFFGGKSSQGSNSSPAKPPAKKEIVEDSDDDDVVITKPPAPKTKAPSTSKPEVPQGEPTTTSDYFSSNKKRGRPPKASSEATTIDKQPSKSSQAVTKTESPKPVKEPTERRETRKTNPSHDTKRASALLNDDKLGDDDIFATDFKKSGKGDDDYMEEDDSESDDFGDFSVKPATSAQGKPAPKTRSALDASNDDDVVMEDAPRPLVKPAKSASPQKQRKRKSEAIDKDDDEDFKLTSKKTGTGASSKKPKASVAKQGPTESKEIQDIFDAIPTIRPPSPPPATGEKKPFKFGGRSRSPAGGSATIPAGAENCLAGLSFVFTGVLDTLGREEGQAIVKKYGGKVTGSPSSKTSYVVLGNDAGPKKLDTIQRHKLKTINEEGLFELIRRLPANGGDGKAAEKHEAKKKAEEQKIREMAAEMDKEEKRKQAKEAKGTEGTEGTKTDDRLWTSKYAPTSLNMICGNKGVVDKLQGWLRDWRKNAKGNFDKPGKDGYGIYRSVMIHGPPGIGKTTAAHLVANLEGYDVVETNASDTRSKKLVETGLVLDTVSLQGYFSTSDTKVKSEKKNLVLIMDEVDGMSAGDRGGVGAMAAIAKKTRIPLILICNERRLQKMKPFDHVTFELPFRRPTVEQIRARLSTICFREGLKIPAQVLDSLIEGTHADIRQVINMLSTVRLDQNNLDFDRGKQMSKSWEKHVILKPWDIVSKILSPQMFSQSSTATLNDKTELYFNDHEFSYLMLQENYLRTRPTRANEYHGKEQKLKLLELADNAASSISDGDLVDRMIHGSQQQWSLMPTHAMFSFVRPASFMYGNMTERSAFTSWLGQNSKQGKLARYVKEIQGRMRLRASGDRHEVRQQYIPLLWDKLVRRLMIDGKEGVEDVIDLMDAYFLTREDWDALVELGLGPMHESKVKLETQTKATFTRLYNQRSHPLPYMKASNVLAPKKAPKEKPDIEDAIDDSDGEEVLADDTKAEDESDEIDLKKDKLIRMPKKKGGTAKSTAKSGSAKGKAKSKKASEDDFVDDDEEPKPKKARDFTIWQLRTSYLSTIKDGIGDRLINVNHSVLNTPGFRAAGWPTASANHTTQLAASIKRTYSPPIPTTTAVSSEYYQISTRETNQRFGFGEDGEDDEGGMVTGKSTTDMVGRRNPLRNEKRIHRKDRQQREQQKEREVEEEDSSDLSDESDEDGEVSQRASEEIKFTKVPVRIRADSSPIRATDRQEQPQVMVTSPSHPSMNSHYRTGSLGTAPSVHERPRRDTTTTTTSSDMSSDHEIDPVGFRRRQIQFSGHDQVIGPSELGKAGSDGLEQVDEHAEDSDAGSVESALSSEFDATAGSASLLGGVGITGSLNSSSPMALMHKLPHGPGSQIPSPRKAKPPAPELQDLPPPRPISTVQPVSLLSKALNARKRAPANPVEKFAVLSGKGLTDALNIRLYVPFSSDPEEPLDLPLARESKLTDQPALVTVTEAIGLALWRYSEERREPAIERDRLTVNRWTLRMVEDGEVEYDFPPLGRASAITDFTSNNNNRAGGMRGRSRGKQYDEFALVEASDSEFEDNERLYPAENASASAEETGDITPTTVTALTSQPILQSKAPRLNPILGQPFSSALNDTNLTPADRPAVPISHATPRLGVSKTLKIRYSNFEASTQAMTLNTSTDSYIAEILDSVCKRWGLDKGNYLLKVMGSNTIAPLDRTVEALGNITELDLVRRRFGPQTLTGSPVSSSPNAPLMVDNPGAPSKKGKKGGQRMMHPLTQKQDLTGGYYRRYYVLRKQSMGFTTSNYRVLTFDNDYLHIMPADTGKNGSDTKTRSINFNDVVGCKVSRRHPKNFRVVVLRGNDATEQKRYDFEARNALEAVEIVDEIKKNMAHYRT